MGIVVARLAPDAIDATWTSNLVGTVSEIQDDPDSPDANWLDAVSTTTLSALRVSFPTPLGLLVTGSAVQEFRVQLRKRGGGGLPTYRLLVYEAGVLRITGETNSLFQASPESFVRSLLWDIGAMNPAGIECHVEQLTLGGTGGSRAAVEVGAVEWNVALNGFSGWGGPL